MYQLDHDKFTILVGLTLSVKPVKKVCNGEIGFDLVLLTTFLHRFPPFLLIKVVDKINNTLRFCGSNRSVFDPGFTRTAVST